MRRFLLLTLLPVILLSAAGVAGANHVIGLPPCPTCASHDLWPRILPEHAKRTDKEGTTTLDGSEVSDQLMGWHTSDTLNGNGGSDILWGDYDPNGQPASQVDRIRGGDGEDFIYGSHGRNLINGGAGNDAISVHYGRGIVNCGPGNDIYHVARSRRKKYQFKNCEQVEYRTESQRGAGLAPLP
jgi:Ca2+-binding RTX toxin-like protein